MYASAPDLLRLLAIPAFAYGAYRDVETRRVPNALWPPLLALGVLCLALEGWSAWHAPSSFALRAFALRTAVSVLIVGGLGVAFAVFPLGFGGADAKAFVTISVLLPTYPAYYLGSVVLPLVPANLRVFSLTVLTNALLCGLAYPLYLVAANAARGDVSPAMAVGKRVPVERLPSEHGKLIEDTAGARLFTGLDLDALRMYCRWRGVTLADLRGNPDLRDPATLPDDRNDPTDGAVHRGARTDGGTRVETEDAPDDAGDGARDDPWGAAAFLDDIEGSAYGTTPATLRDGLDLVANREAVWMTPGTPFFVLIVAGLLVSFVFGDVLFAVLGVAGLV